MATFFAEVIKTWFGRPVEERSKFYTKHFDSMQYHAQQLMLNHYSRLKEIWTPEELSDLRFILNTLSDWDALKSDIKFMKEKDDLEPPDRKLLNAGAVLLELFPKELLKVEDAKYLTTLPGLKIFISKLANKFLKAEKDRATARFVTIHPALITKYIENGELGIKIVGYEDSENGNHAGIVEDLNGNLEVILPDGATEGRLFTEIKKRIKTNGIEKYIGYSPEKEYIQEHPELVRHAYNIIKNKGTFSYNLPPEFSQRIFFFFLRKAIKSMEINDSSLENAQTTKAN